MRRFALLITIVALTSLGLAVPVLAAPPSSDLYATRTVIATFPFAETVDTSEATTDADDVELNGQCGAPATDASVWYEYTATTDASFLVETNNLTYSAGIIVATGSPGSFAVQACGPYSVAVPGVTGETYAILVFDFQDDGGGNGGTVDVAVREAPPPPVLDLTVAATGKFNAITGSATIRGTVTCTGGEVNGKNFIDVQVTQAVGRFRFTGQGYSLFACDGTSQPWSAEVFSPSGKFAGGKASVMIYAFACGYSGCADFQTTASVTLKR